MATALGAQRIQCSINFRTTGRIRQARTSAEARGCARTDHWPNKQGMRRQELQSHRNAPFHEHQEIAKLYHSFDDALRFESGVCRGRLGPDAARENPLNPPLLSFQTLTIFQQESIG